MYRRWVFTKQQLTEKMKKGTHIVWGTGGSMVPEDVMDGYYKKVRHLR